MKIIRESQQKWTPWKNGGGETVEIAHGPSGSTLDNFDWRISRARVERSGPFSFFSGIDRTLAVLHGDNLRLRIDQAAPINLSTSAPPLLFAGEARVESDVTEPIMDLNVMTRRGKFQHRMTALAEGQSLHLSATDDAVTVIFTTGAATLHWMQSQEQLAANDAAFLSAQDGTLGVHPAPSTRLYLIEIWPSRA